MHSQCFAPDLEIQEVHALINLMGPGKTNRWHKLQKRSSEKRILDRDGPEQILLMSARKICSDSTRSYTSDRGWPKLTTYKR